jgi:CRP-like cAMP-binding protein
MFIKGIIRMEQKILKIVDIIDSNPILFEIFKSCPLEILYDCNLKEYPAGAVIWNQGEIIDNFNIIVNGFADIYLSKENGNKYYIGTHQSGAFIGEIEIFEKKPSVCTVEAYTAVTVLKIKQDSFLKWLSQDGNIKSQVIKVLSGEFYDYSLKAGNDILYPLKVRICSYLLSRSKQLSTKTADIVVKVNKAKLSEELAVTPRSIHRVLHNLQSKDIIEVKTDAIIIKDLNKLASEEENQR